jgi:hypothetical protein
VFFVHVYSLKSGEESVLGDIQQVWHAWMSIPRCCLIEPVPLEFEPCYASVLVYGAQAKRALAMSVAALERDEPIVSCFTAWCPRCRGNYFLTRDISCFPTPSAHHTHKLVLLQMLRDQGVYSNAGVKPGL